MKVKIANLIKIFIIMSLGTVSFVLISCMTWNPRLVDPMLKDNIESFKKETGHESLFGVSVKFMTLNENTAGFCNPITNEVFIDPVEYFKMSKIEQKALVYHELAHCVCWAMHTTQRLKEDKCPKSIMYPSVFSENCLKKHWKKYIMDINKRCE